ncbi:MAG: response regulator transcription factor, partial [Vulcanimicrobiaceae bacterium]
PDRRRIRVRLADSAVRSNRHMTNDNTVYVVDDDEAVRKGLTFLLRTANHAVETFTSAWVFLDSYDPMRRGCLLLDIRMPHMTGLELLHELNARTWSIPTVFMTGHATVPIAIAAMKAGAFDFIEKPLRDDTLLESVERALLWDATKRVDQLRLADLKTRAAALTAREREVLDLVAAGEPNKEIGRQLGISFRTVELHRSHILEKMQARTTSELIRMAILLLQDKS